MSKYELSITKDYVPSWGIVDAVRELFQNALDQEVTQEGNDMFFGYDEERQVLTVGNKLSVLDKKSLLLGASTKADDDKTIGKFGEGYKIATLVLTRLGKKVTFFNYGAKEVWRSRFVKSRRYDTDILTFFIDKKYPWQSVPNHNLYIEVEGVSKEEYEEVVKSNLHLSQAKEYHETEVGRVLLDAELRGKVFVNGLFICNYEPYHYGYDFKPSVVNIDRDRKLVDSFDLKYLASRMWLNLDSTEMIKLSADLVRKQAQDVAFIDSLAIHDNAYKRIATKVHEDFVKEHGEDSIPVTSSEEYKQYEGNYKPVIVDNSLKAVIRSSEKYQEPVIDTSKVSVKDQLELWYKENALYLPRNGAQELKSLIEQVKN